MRTALIECHTLSGKKRQVPKNQISLRAAGYAVVIRDGCILLCRSKSSGKYWFPGGGIEPGESLIEGMKREVREETGIQITVDRFLIFEEVFFCSDHLNQAYQNLSFFYLCRPETDALLPDDAVHDQESEKPHWVELSSLQVSDFNFGAEAVLEQIRSI